MGEVTALGTTRLRTPELRVSTSIVDSVEGGPGTLEAREALTVVSGVTLTLLARPDASAHLHPGTSAPTLFVNAATPTRTNQGGILGSGRIFNTSAVINAGEISPGMSPADPIGIIDITDGKYATQAAGKVFFELGGVIRRAAFPPRAPVRACRARLVATDASNKQGWVGESRFSPVRSVRRQSSGWLRLAWASCSGFAIGGRTERVGRIPDPRVNS